MCYCVQVSGLGPQFQLNIRVQNLSSKPFFGAVVSLAYDTANYAIKGAGVLQVMS